MQRLSTYVVLAAVVLLTACEQQRRTSLSFILTPSPTHDLSGTVTSAAGEPITGVMVTFTTGRRATSRTAATPNGFYRIAGLEPGTVVVTITADGYVAVTRTVTVISDVVLDVTLVPLPPA